VQGEPNLAVTVAVCGMLAAKRGSDKPLSVLDVGCGNGAIPLGLKATGVAYTYYGTDISPKAIEKAKELCADAQFECIDMEQGTTTDRKFDVVIFSEVLLYADWKKTFAEHRRNMRADTVVIISLYRTIRTWLIWRYFLPRLKLLYEYRIRDVRKKNAWDICVGTPQ
jgi:2-polyprenyl-3-methyl-5-hydroxy-6-metoxy-1,4-benzoquinol methylase